MHEFGCVQQVWTAFSNKVAQEHLAASTEMPMVRFAYCKQLSHKTVSAFSLGTVLEAQEGLCWSSLDCKPCCSSQKMPTHRNYNWQWYQNRSTCSCMWVCLLDFYRKNGSDYPKPSSELGCQQCPLDYLLSSQESQIDSSCKIYPRYLSKWPQDWSENQGHAILSSTCKIAVSQPKAISELLGTFIRLRAKSVKWLLKQSG